MKLIDTVSLEIAKDSDVFSETQCYVNINNANTKIIISGKTLEAAIFVDVDLYLLFTTDGIDYEETLKISLIHLKKGLLEVVSLGGQYLTGTFEKLRVRDDYIAFSFFGDTTWTVRVMRDPSLRLPFSDPRGVSRRFGFKKFIDISANPPLARADGRR